MIHNHDLISQIVRLRKLKLGHKSLKIDINIWYLDKNLKSLQNPILVTTPGSFLAKKKNDGINVLAELYREL